MRRAKCLNRLHNVVEQIGWESGVRRAVCSIADLLKRITISPVERAQGVDSKKPDLSALQTRVRRMVVWEVQEGDSELGGGSGTEYVQAFQTPGSHLVPFDRKGCCMRLFLAKQMIQTRDKKFVESGNIELGIGVEKDGCFPPTPEDFALMLGRHQTGDQDMV